MRRTISVLSPDFSGNAIGRAYLLAKLLQEEFEVHVVAYGETDDIWEPIKSDTTLTYRRYCHKDAPEFYFNTRRTARRLIEGDLIYAIKPLLPSFGLGLQARRLMRRPLLLDIDDWEIGFLSDSLYWEFRHFLAGWVLKTRSPLYTRLLDRITWRADAITVSNGFLQQKYGGHWIPHARDERLFPPRSAVKVDRKTAIFLGSARMNKGLDVLLDAWPRVTDPEARLRIVGTPPDSPVLRPLLQRADSRVVFEGPVPFEQMPRMIASAGVVVIPQQMARGSVGQLPAKLIDAMAAGRPIVSTAVGDIPSWLAGGAGLVVPPGDPVALGDSLQRLLSDPDQGVSLGDRARSRYERYGSFAAVGPRLIELVSAMIDHRPLPASQGVFSTDESRREGHSAWRPMGARVLEGVP